MSRIIYLHGFASSPGSRKAQYLAGVLREQGFTVEIPALDGGDFEHLTVSGMLQLIEELTGAGPVDLIGSSLGGYTAALHASRHPDRVRRLVLLAPAFDFLNRWPDRLGPQAVEAWERNGQHLFAHYADGQDRPLHWKFVEDSRQYPAFPSFPHSALLIHGTLDDVVPATVSRRFVEQHPAAQLLELESGHELTDRLEVVADQTLRFLRG